MHIFHFKHVPSNSYCWHFVMQHQELELVFRHIGAHTQIDRLTRKSKELFRCLNASSSTYCDKSAVFSNKSAGEKCGKFKICGSWGILNLSMNLKPNIFNSNWMLWLNEILKLNTHCVMFFVDTYDAFE